MKNIAIAALSLLLGACAVGNKHEYTKSVPDVALSSQNSVAVGVHDQRSYVVSGGKSAAFVGLLRGGYGNPFDVTTGSDKPLADDMRETIAQAFKRNGIAVKEIQIRPADSVAAARQALVTVGQQRGLLLTLAEWKSDTFMNTSLAYDLRLVVVDASGKVLAEKAVRGGDNLGGNMMNAPAHAKEAIPAAYKRKLEELLASPEIKQALQ